jgi:hypothetical protein
VVELLGETSVVEGRQVEQVFKKDRELKFKRPTRNTSNSVKNAEKDRKEVFPDFVSEANLLPQREKKTPPEHESTFIEFFPEFAPLTKKKIRVWSVASCTGKVFLTENKTVRMAYTAYPGKIQ